MAMPPPIVPAPMTPTLRIGSASACRPARPGSSRPRARRRRRGAAPRTARRSMQLHEQLALDARGPRRTAGSTAASIAAGCMLPGASKPRNLRAFSLRKSAKISGLPRAASTLSCRSRTRRSGRSSSTTRAREGDRARRAACPRSTSSSTSPTSAPLCAGPARREVIIVERRSDADQARQALRAAGARQQAELHFGQADLGRGHRDAVVAAQRHLEPAAERRAVDRGDHRLGRVLDRSSQLGQRSAIDRRLAEFGDVGAGDEGAAGADQHDGVTDASAARQPPARRAARRVALPTDCRSSGGELTVTRRFDIGQTAGHGIDAGHGLALARSVDFEQAGSAHAAADAHGDDAELGAAALAFDQQRGRSCARPTCRRGGRSRWRRRRR